MADTMITTTKKRLVEVLTENGLTPEQIKKVVEDCFKQPHMNPITNLLLTITKRKMSEERRSALNVLIIEAYNHHNNIECNLSVSSLITLLKVLTLDKLPNEEYTQSSILEGVYNWYCIKNNKKKMSLMDYRNV